MVKKNNLTQQEKEDILMKMSIKYDEYKTSYKTVQTSLDSIIKDPEIKEIINKYVIITNKIVYHSYNFFKLYCLHLIVKNIKLPKIDRKFLNLIMKVICISDSRGKKKGDEKQQLMNSLIVFFNNVYKPLMDNEILSYTHLNTVLDYESESMITCILNHIREHFESIFNRYVNVIVNKSMNENTITNNFDGKLRKTLISNYRKELSYMKKYLYEIYNGTNENDAINNLQTNKKLMEQKLKYTRKQLTDIKTIFKEDLKKSVLNYCNRKIKSMEVDLKIINVMIDKEIAKKKVSDNIKFKNIKNILVNKINSNGNFNRPLKDEVENDPINLLSFMISMSIEIENRNNSTETLKIFTDLTDTPKYTNLINYLTKQITKPKIKIFTCFPLRSSTAPKCVKLDTTTIIHMFINNNKVQYLTKGNTKKEEQLIWSLFFKTNKRVFRCTKHTFNHSIVTDGIRCSLLFVRKDLHKLDRKTTVRAVRKPYNYKSEKYIDDLSDMEKIEYYNYKLVGIDPGVNNLLFATDGTRRTVVNNDTGKVKLKPNTFSYTRIQRKKEIKSKKYSRQIEINKKITMLTSNNELLLIGDTNGEIYDNRINCDGKTVKEIESELSEYDSKSCIYENALNYIRKKNEINFKLSEFYQKPLFRKLKWFSMINKQRSEANMINNFKKKFGDPENILICFGDWSKGNTKKFQEPTKGKSLRKLFKDNGFKLFLVDEYRTSKMSHLLENEQSQKMKKFKRISSPRPYRQGNHQLCHGLLRSKYVLNNKSNKHLVMNRDLNGSLNILYKAKCLLQNIEIPPYLSRT